MSEGSETTTPSVTISEEVLSLSFEEALEALKVIVQKLESGEGKLDDAIVAYERGAQLKAHCERKLAEAQAKIEKISFGADGSVKTQAFESE